MSRTDIFGRPIEEINPKTDQITKVPIPAAGNLDDDDSPPRGQDPIIDPKPSKNSQILKTAIPAAGNHQHQDSQPLGPLPFPMSNKEHMEFLRDYYSTPPDDLEVTKHHHRCQHCSYEWKSLNSHPKKCPYCHRHHWKA